MKQTWQLSAYLRSIHPKTLNSKVSLACSARLLARVHIISGEYVVIGPNKGILLIGLSLNFRVHLA